jgi:hypothetical protein
VLLWGHKHLLLPRLLVKLQLLVLLLLALLWSLHLLLLLQPITLKTLLLLLLARLLLLLRVSPGAVRHIKLVLLLLLPLSVAPALLLCYHAFCLQRLLPLLPLQQLLQLAALLLPWEQRRINLLQRLLTPGTALQLAALLPAANCYGRWQEQQRLQLSKALPEVLQLLLAPVAALHCRPAAPRNSPR